MLSLIVKIRSLLLKHLFAFIVAFYSTLQSMYLIYRTGCLQLV